MQRSHYGEKSVTNKIVIVITFCSVLLQRSDYHQRSGRFLVPYFRCVAFFYSYGHCGSVNVLVRLSEARTGPQQSNGSTLATVRPPGVVKTKVEQTW